MQKYAKISEIDIDASDIVSNHAFYFQRHNTQQQLKKTTDILLNDSTLACSVSWLFISLTLRPKEGAAARCECDWRRSRHMCHDAQSISMGTQFTPL